MVLLFLLRIYSRMFVTRSLGWDDYTCVLGVIGTASFAGIYSTMLRYGDGRQILDITHSQYQGSFKYLLACLLFSGPTIFFIKISILIFYQRIFSLDRRMRILIYLGAGYSLLGNFVSTILHGAFCVPRNRESIAESFQSPSCAKTVRNMGPTASTLNLIGDIYILLLPIPSILKLQLPKRRNIALVLIFLGGLGACAASLVALLFRVKFNPGQHRIFWDSRTGFALFIEMNIGIICASMPACAAFFNQFNSNCICAFPTRKLKSWFAKSSIDSVSRKTVVETDTASLRGTSMDRVRSHQEDSLEPGLSPEGVKIISNPIDIHSSA